MDLKSWNSDIKNLREIILKPEKLEESKYLCLKLHSMVHSSEMSGLKVKTFEDELWDGLDENTFRTARNSKGRTIAYGLWHSTRIEDITMNILVANSKQVFQEENWQERIKSTITDTGNSLTTDQILELSSSIDWMELRNYRTVVGRKTREIIKNFELKDLKRKFSKDQLQRIFDEGGVLDVDGASWLVDFWGRKTVAGILLMPVTRHHVVHINESFEAKKKKI